MLPVCNSHVWFFIALPDSISVFWFENFTSRQCQKSHNATLFSYQLNTITLQLRENNFSHIVPLKQTYIRKLLLLFGVCLPEFVDWLAAVCMFSIANKFSYELNELTLSTASTAFLSCKLAGEKSIHRPIAVGSFQLLTVSCAVICFVHSFLFFPWILLGLGTRNSLKITAIIWYYEF